LSHVPDLRICALQDAEARRKIVEELDKTFFVEAGAGSGKTKSLVDRMIALLGAGKCRIGTLAAVTFTRKAAAELRGRFQVELERKVAAEKNPETIKRLADALQNLEQCYIGTIHSFCAKMLRERPIEIGLDPEFTEMEEIEDGVFREKCWNDYMVKVRLEQEEIVRELEEVDLAPEDLKDAFEAVSLYPEVTLVGGSGDEPDFAYFRKALEDFLKLARGLIPKEKPEKGYDGLQRLIVRCLGRQRNLGFSDRGLLMETIELLGGKAEIRWNRWPERERAETLNQALEVFVENVVEPAMKAWREYRQEKIIRFLGPAVRFYTERRKEENSLNYEDLLMQARKLLHENPEVRRYFSRKFTHILVDELQDTDPIQAEVLLYLKGLDTKERDWRKMRVEPGALFLVGDPKQSIFRFRWADIDTYNLVKETIVAGGGEVLRLTTNFRSLGVLAEWNNPVFKAVFPAESTRYQAAFAPLVTVRKEEEGGASGAGGVSGVVGMSGVRKIVLPAVPRNKGEDIAAMDAAVIAEWIRLTCNSGNSGDTNFNSQESPWKGERTPPRSGIKVSVPGTRDGTQGRAAQPSDLLILFRYKKNMDLYARALEERGVPFEITGSDAFAGAEEIQEITNLARALNDPDNPIYTVAVLRGIFFGVSDEDLVEFKRESGRFNFMAPRKEVFECKHLGAANVSLGLKRLKEWRGWTLRMPPSAALSKIFEESGILNYLASKEMGSSRVGNLLKLLEMFRKEESEGRTAFSGAVEFLEELADVREIEEISLTPGRANAVRLMNLHKAKGLEARVVFLANPVGIKEHAVDKHVVRTAGVVPLGFFAFSKRVGHQTKMLSQPSGWEKAAEQERKYEDAEEQRLMYVAATRAKDMMVVSTYAGDLKDRRAWPTLDDALAGVPELEGTADWLRAMKNEEFRFEAIPREKVSVKKTEVERARKEIKANTEAGGEPTYMVETVTALAKKESEAPAARRRGAGLGLSWGRIVHQVLEAIGSGRLSFPSLEADRRRPSPSSPTPLIKGEQKGKREAIKISAATPMGEVWSEEERKKLRSFIENILAADESDGSDIDGLVDHVESILSSPFWARVMKAERRHFEIPFSIRTSQREIAELGRSKSYLLSAGFAKKSGFKKEAEPGRDGKPTGASQESDARGPDEIPVILTGMIDLVFWEDNDRGLNGKEAERGKETAGAGWVIADYKTDYIRPQLLEEDLAGLAAAYAPQVRLYTRFWSQITGEPVLEAGLYFTSINRWVKA